MFIALGTTDRSHQPVLTPWWINTQWINCEEQCGWLIRLTIGCQVAYFTMNAFFCQTIHGSSPWKCLPWRKLICIFNFLLYLTSQTYLKQFYGQTKLAKRGYKLMFEQRKEITTHCLDVFFPSAQSLALKRFLVVSTIEWLQPVTVFVTYICWRDFK